MRLMLAFALLLLATPARAEPNACLDAFASRYAAEAERNLSRVFALAQQSDVILEFDEADALFGERTQTREAHDRYANQEVSYLLARIESFEGVEHLTSNLRGHGTSARRRMLAAGFDRGSNYAGLILMETEGGVRAIEFARADRRRAFAYARETLAACPPAAD